MSSTPALNGSWQIRGYQSLNGIVTDQWHTGKVIDFEVFSKHCRCKTAFNSVHKPSCIANYSGTSGIMEGKVLKAIFKRSEAHEGVRYIKYLSDGDSRGFSSILALSPYGTQVKKKFECVRHIQKRIGTLLLDLNSKNKRKKLSDGKSLSGHNRLTHCS
ncbi:uncharacterized protein TNCV_1449271 [Trichonephila clavipes]|nr:uncharacterized protein TNCV_1449271 [Trichonephila clavipes]